MRRELDGEMLIALIGLDGSGKTTLSRSLTSHLREEGEKVSVIRPFNYFLLRPVLDAARGVAGLLGGDVRKGAGSFATGGKVKPRVARFWPYVAMVDNLLYYCLCILPRLALGYLVISDRYFYDLSLIFDYHGCSSPRAKRIYENFVPRPDLTFVLDLSPDAALSRAGEMDIGYFRQQRERYISIAGRLGLRIVDAERPVEEVAEAIKKEIRTCRGGSGGRKRSITTG